VRSVRRHGKQVLLELEKGVLLVRLGMTGSLRAGGAAGPHTRAVFHLDRGGVVRFEDIRQFGSLRWLPQSPVDDAPDPLAILPDDFARRLAGRNTPVKRLLLDQAFLRGIGNIYADEILFRARIHPSLPSGSLSSARMRRLHRTMQTVLSEAIAHGGSTVSDYVDATGRPGRFQLLHRVYRRQGRPCPRCGAAILRIVVAQRGTHYCPICQPR